MFEQTLISCINLQGNSIRWQAAPYYMCTSHGKAQCYQQSMAAIPTHMAIMMLQKLAARHNAKQHQHIYALFVCDTCSLIHWVYSLPSWHSISFNRHHVPTELGSRCHWYLGDVRGREGIYYPHVVGNLHVNMYYMFKYMYIYMCT